MKLTNYRWRVVALLFCATTINYIDRQVLAQLKPFLTDDLGITESEYGFIVSAFQAAYAIGMLVAGRLIDGCRMLSASQYGRLQAVFMRLPQDFTLLPGLVSCLP